MSGSREEYAKAGYVWALATLCAVHRRPFDAALLLKQFPPPYGQATLIQAARGLGFKAEGRTIEPASLARLPLPVLVELYPDEEPVAAPLTEGAETQVANPAGTHSTRSLALVIAVSNDQIVWLPANSQTPVTTSRDAFNLQLTGLVILARPEDEPLRDPDDTTAARLLPFGFRWFIPELLKHRKVWHEVLAASLVLQLLALGLPLFTQAIIDKVVVHRTESTLIALAIGMAVFMVFTALLTWVRQYAILHTGNRVDAVLGSAVFQHLFRLPPKYFQNRPTGVIAARLHGVETTRYIDITSGTLLQTNTALISPSTAPNKYIIFGDSAADVINGSAQDDHLYGGSGADTIDGQGGGDWLEGGKGADTYQFSGAFGTDTILDSDGSGQVVLDGRPLSGGKKLSASIWLSEDRKTEFHFVQGASAAGAYSGVGTLRIYRAGTATGGSGITVKNWKPGNLGINLDADRIALADLPGSAGRISISNTEDKVNDIVLGRCLRRIVRYENSSCSRPLVVDSGHISLEFSLQAANAEVLPCAA